MNRRNIIIIIQYIYRINFLYLVLGIIIILQSVNLVELDAARCRHLAYMWFMLSYIPLNCCLDKRCDGGAQQTFTGTVCDVFVKEIGACCCCCCTLDIRLNTPAIATATTIVQIITTFIVDVYCRNEKADEATVVLLTP